MKGRRGRRCIYKNCGHHQNMDDKKCVFHTFPKDLFKARRWLNASGVTTVTPKKIVPSWTICSCHFPNGKDRDSLPQEYVEEYDSDDGDNIIQLKRPRGTPVKDAKRDSPARKNLLLSLTPNTKDAVDTLISLPNIFPCVAEVSLQKDIEPEIKEEIISPAVLTYSPRRSHWALRGSVVRNSARKTLSQMMDFAISTPHNSSLHAFSLTESSLHEEDLDLGCCRLANDDNGKETLADDCSPIATIETPSPVEPPTDQDLNFSCQKVVGTRSTGIQCERPFLCYEKCKFLSEEDFRFYTGVSPDVFELLYSFLGGDAVCTKLKYTYNRKSPTKFTESELTPKDRLFMTLLRLRRGITLRDLKILFKVSVAYSSKIVYSWIRFMAEEFKKLEEVMFVSGPAQDGLRPPCFKHFPNLRVIIDCTEFRIQRPQHLQQQRDCFSEYKGASTIKFLIGISCMGGLSYISEGYEGSISDRRLVEKSGFLDLLDSGDAIMADKGFDIEDKCDEQGIELLIPSFRRSRDYFTARELMWSRVIAESRVHVETYIGKLKEFRLIRYVIPNSMLAVASDIVKVCAMLVNFQYPFIRIPDEETDTF